MELLQNWRDVLMSSYTSDQTRRSVLDGLYASEQIVGDAVQKRIAVVQAVRDKRLDQSLSRGSSVAGYHNEYYFSISSVGP